MTRRLISRLDPAGRSCVVSDEPIPALLPAVHLAWATATVPADAAAPPVSASGPNLMDLIHAGGTTFLLVRTPPGAVTPIHATNSIDYITVLSGEITVVTETGDAVLRAGDLMVQGGVLHGWRNDGAVEAVYSVVTVPAHPVAGGRIDPAP